MKKLLVTFVFMAPIVSEAYRCVDADGTVKYQDFMCEVNHPQADSVSSLKISAPKKYVGEKISLNFQSVDVRQVLQIIAGVGGFKLDLDPSVQGSIAMQYVGIPWDQALDMALHPS